MTSTRMTKLIAMLVALAAAAVLWAPTASAKKLPTPKASHFGRHSNLVTNVWFPLARGSVYVYDGQKDGKTARDVMTVTRKVKKITGIRAARVHDRLFLNGRLAERTTDWYAQDKNGTVWYLGEKTAELNAKGKVTNTSRSRSRLPATNLPSLHTASAPSTCFSHSSPEPAPPARVSRPTCCSLRTCSALNGSDHR